ncbi:MAG: TraR/DksA family transcriptional regulator [Actinobacteria bacterium]|nr:TraR/DksA family transcriptional regulator [Actinomycetota bacterium]
MNELSQTKVSSAGDLAQIAALKDDLATARDQLSRVTAEYEAMLSAHDTIQEDRDATAQLVAQARAAVSRLETALVRAEAGTYGRCERCGSAIPKERLAVLPDASTCVSCA